MIISKELLFSLKPRVHIFMVLEDHGLINALREALPYGSHTFLGILPADTQLRGGGGG